MSKNLALDLSHERQPRTGSPKHKKDEPVFVVMSSRRQQQQRKQELEWARRQAGGAGGIRGSARYGHRRNNLNHEGELEGRFGPGSPLSEYTPEVRTKGVGSGSGGQDGRSDGKDAKGKNVIVRGRDGDIPSYMDKKTLSYLGGGSKTSSSVTRSGGRKNTRPQTARGVMEGGWSKHSAHSAVHSTVSAVSGGPSGGAAPTSNNTRYHRSDRKPGIPPFHSARGEPSTRPPKPVSPGKVYAVHQRYSLFRAKYATGKDYEPEFVRISIPSNSPSPGRNANSSFKQQQERVNVHRTSSCFGDT